METDVTSTTTEGWLSRVRVAWQRTGGSFPSFAADIKLAHSVFALPFAASAFLVGPLPLPTLTQALYLLLCMVGARSFAMGMNRFLDRGIDAANPRTTGRAVPSGRMTPAQCFAWSGFSALVLVGAAFALNPLAGWLSLPLLGVLTCYSMMKRLSWGTHWYLGACLGFAPIAVAIAIEGSVPGAVYALGLAVTLWTAGFDILYALQDYHFDRENGFYSVPACLGPAKGLWISRFCFAAMALLLFLIGSSADMGPVYFMGVAIVSFILIYEQWLVRDASDDGRSERINAAFFTSNAYVSVVYFAFAALDTWIFP